MDCLGCFVRAGSGERAWPPGRARLTLPLPEGPPLMYPLDVTQVVLRRWRAGVRGRIDPRIGIGAGAPACLRRQACSRSNVLSHAWCQACVELCLLAREGSMLGWVIVSCIMPWRSSFPCYRMCCGPDTLLWFALSVFRTADMVGIDGHVSLSPKTKRTRCVCKLSFTPKRKREEKEMDTKKPDAGRQIPLSQDVLRTRQSPVVCFICLSGC